MDTIKTATLENGNTISIVLDCDSENPREWDNLSQIILFGKYSHVGDKHDIDLSDYTFNDRWDFIERGAEAVRKQIKDVVVILPVHVYEHGSIGFSTSMSSYPYNCQWDSGTIGFCVVTKQAIKENWTLKKVTQKYIDRAEKIAKAELETLSQWANGEVYGFIIKDADGKHVNSCYGFYGYDIHENGMTDYLEEKYIKALDDSN